MAKKQDLSAGLEIERVWANRYEGCPGVYEGCPGVIGIDWSGDIGFGQFELVLDDNGTWHVRSENLVSGENKEFMKAIFEKLLQYFLENAVIDD